MADRLEVKIILVRRRTRLEDLLIRFNAVSQARFYVEHLGADFGDYEKEHATYLQAVTEASAILERLGRLLILPREFVPNYLFQPGDVVVALGQDGLVANTLKYLQGQTLVGVNPDPTRYDGLLLPFRVQELERVMPEVVKGKRPVREVTMAEARLNTGLQLLAVNDFFIGQRTHLSARYELELAGVRERHSSSGIIISTGLGSTAWLRSIVTGALSVAAWAQRELTSSGTSSTSIPIPDPLAGTGFSSTPAGTSIPRPEEKGRKNKGKASRDKGASEGVGTAGSAHTARGTASGQKERFGLSLPWDADQLLFSVREPFPSVATGTSLICGRIAGAQPLKVRSLMAENGVIFSDGVESDFLEFNAGTEAVVGLSPRKGRLVL